MNKLQRELDRIEKLYGRGGYIAGDRKPPVEAHRLGESDYEYFARHGNSLFIPATPYKGKGHA